MLYNQMASQVAESDEDFLSGKFCECRHLLESEHSSGKCYGLNFNGAIWISCLCNTPRPLIFQLRISIGVENAESSTRSS